MQPPPRPGKEIDPAHQQKRRVLRFIGPSILAVGGIFMLIGFVDFVGAMSHFGGPPTKFWCLFLGMPLLWLGGVLTSAGFMGATSRYIAAEQAPVATDTFNYVADATKDSVKELATAVGTGLAAARGPEKLPVVQIRCHKCNTANEADARFCKSCGTSLAKTRPCPACQELNDPDARFCDACGKSFSL